MLYLCLMDKELEKRWLKLPRVEVDSDEGVLIVDDEYLSLPDITPGMLSDYIEIGYRTIKGNLAEMRRLSRFWASAETRPLLLLGRLAMSGEEAEVFTDEGLIAIRKTEHITMDEVLPEYRPYWETIEDSLYAPVVRRRATFNDTSMNGTWLGMRRP